MVVRHSRRIPGHCWRCSWANSSRFAAESLVGGERRGIDDLGDFLNGRKGEILLLFLSFTSSLASLHPRKKKSKHTHKQKRRKVRASEKRGKTLNERRLRARHTDTRSPISSLIGAVLLFFFSFFFFFRSLGRRAIVSPTQ